ncbi:unnamed protein product [Bubo scandiacus]
MLAGQGRTPGFPCSAGNTLQAPETQAADKIRKAALRSQNNSHVANAIQSEISNTVTRQKFIASASGMNLLEP